MKLEIRGDVFSNNAKVALVDGDQRTELRYVQQVALSAEDPFLNVKMFVPEFDIAVDLPEQTGELMKVVAQLQAKLDSCAGDIADWREQNAEHLGAGDILREAAEQIRQRFR